MIYLQLIVNKIFYLQMDHYCYYEPNVGKIKSITYLVVDAIIDYYCIYSVGVLWYLPYLGHNFYFFFVYLEKMTNKLVIY